MTIMTVNIGGDNVGCNIVVAKILRGSSITAAAPGVSGELPRYLTDLHKAVAELSTKLPDDEALLAARYLKDLTEQVTSEQPMETLWKRAANGLLDSARRLADPGLPAVDMLTVGLPVIALVTKVVDLVRKNVY